MKTIIREGNFNAPLVNIFNTVVFTADKLKVAIYPNRLSMGMASASALVSEIKNVARRKKEVNIMFASAPSQNEVLDALIAYRDVPWNKMNCFHMDEYLGLDEKHPQSFRRFLLEKVFTKIQPKSLHLIKGEAKNPEEECRRYARLLENYPLDILQGGIGLVPHIAFNDPENADFNDSYLVKIVKLQKESRIQQVKDGCFRSLKEVPKSAITVTVPPLIKAKYVSLVVPSAQKARAVEMTIFNKIDSFTPAAIMRVHNNAIMFLEPDSSALLKKIAIVRHIL
ncbi:MAG: glucosamine-6-phosphate deaminase [Elusimicrobia bacterium CG_4_10_14_0_8_um_filter_37_32]|nr:MAG: glucosamine-6-phosphate deaminase [Elusimicrobia bacterium CG_4_10_14_0_8_um_filter_37_32]